MATKKIQLIREWSGHQAGEIVEEQDFTVESMIRKGFGVPYEGSRVKSHPKGPVVETTKAAPAAETMDARPRFGRTAEQERPGKAGD